MRVAWCGGEVSLDCAKPVADLGVCGTYSMIRHESIVLGWSNVFNRRHLREVCASCREAGVGISGDYC